MEIAEKYLFSYANNCKKALAEYQNDEPLANFLSRFFKKNRQMGSKDRKVLSRFCYNYYRIGKLAEPLAFLDRLVIAEFLCESKSALVDREDEYLSQNMNLNPYEKLDFLYENYGWDRRELFPDTVYLSREIDRDLFLGQQLVQPDLFIRVKRKEADYVIDFLNQRGINFEVEDSCLLAFTNNTDLGQFRQLDGKYEVQDRSSQKTLGAFPQIESGELWWDACAGSGGKALMLLDKYPDVKLMLTDKRFSILKNLEQRFHKAKIASRHSVRVVDLLQETIDLPGQQPLFDGIMLDVPCSGSGTWSRTPEMKAQWKGNEPNPYADIQRKMVRNVLPYLKNGGALMYITCSAYRTENEDMVEYMVDELNLTEVSTQLIKGYENKADTMFVSRLVKA